jgi:hypothetical protein
MKLIPELFVFKIDKIVFLLDPGRLIGLSGPIKQFRISFLKSKRALNHKMSLRIEDSSQFAL